MGRDPIPSETPAKSKRRGFCCTELKPKTASMRRRVKPYSQLSTHARLFPAPGTDCQGSTSDLGDPSQNAPFSLFPNPLSPEHAMVHVSGLTDETTPIRVLASDGRVVWQGTGIKCPRSHRLSHSRIHITRHLLHSGRFHLSIRKHRIDGLVIGLGSARNQ